MSLEEECNSILEEKNFNFAKKEKNLFCLISKTEEQHMQFISLIFLPSVKFGLYKFLTLLRLRVSSHDLYYPKFKFVNKCGVVFFHTIKFQGGRNPFVNKVITIVQKYVLKGPV